MSALEYILLGSYLFSILAVTLDTDSRMANKLWFGYIVPAMDAAEAAAEENKKR